MGRQARTSLLFSWSGGVTRTINQIGWRSGENQSWRVRKISQGSLSSAELDSCVDSLFCAAAPMTANIFIVIGGTAREGPLSLQGARLL